MADSSTPNAGGGPRVSRWRYAGFYPAAYTCADRVGRWIVPGQVMEWAQPPDGMWTSAGDEPVTAVAGSSGAAVLPDAARDGPAVLPVPSPDVPTAPPADGVTVTEPTPPPADPPAAGQE